MSGPTFERKKSAVVQSNRILCKQIVRRIFARLVQASFPPTTCPSLSDSFVLSTFKLYEKSHRLGANTSIYVTHGVVLQSSQPKKKEKKGGSICASAFASAGRESGSEVESEERRWRRPLGELLSCLSGRIMTHLTVRSILPTPQGNHDKLVHQSPLFLHAGINFNCVFLKLCFPSGFLTVRATRQEDGPGHDT